MASLGAPTLGTASRAAMRGETSRLRGPVRRAWTTSRRGASCPSCSRGCWAGRAGADATAAMLLNALEVGIVLCGTYWLVGWSADPQLKRTGGRLDIYIGVYAALVVVELSSSLTRQLLSVRGVISATHAMHKALLYRVLHAPQSFFDSVPRERILGWFTTQVGHRACAPLRGTPPHTPSLARAPAAALPRRAHVHGGGVLLELLLLPDGVHHRAAAGDALGARARGRPHARVRVLHGHAPQRARARGRGRRAGAHRRACCWTRTTLRRSQRTGARGPWLAPAASRSRAACGPGEQPPASELVSSGAGRPKHAHDAAEEGDSDMDKAGQRCFECGRIAPFPAPTRHVDETAAMALLDAHVSASSTAPSCRAPSCGPQNAAQVQPPARRALRVQGHGPGTRTCLSEMLATLLGGFYLVLSAVVVVANRVTQPKTQAMSRLKLDHGLPTLKEYGTVITASGACFILLEGVYASICAAFVVEQFSDMKLLMHARGALLWTIFGIPQEPSTRDDAQGGRQGRGHREHLWGGCHGPWGRRPGRHGCCSCGGGMPATARPRPLLHSPCPRTGPPRVSWSSRT